MARRILLSLACVAVLAGTAWLASRPGDPAQAQGAGAPKADPFAPPAGFVVFPYLQYATPTTITVMWETASPGTSVVRYGLSSPTKTAEGAKDATMHEVELTGLEPGKAHVYSVETVTKDGKVRGTVTSLMQTNPITTSSACARDTCRARWPITTPSSPS